MLVVLTEGRDFGSMNQGSWSETCEIGKQGDLELACSTASTCCARNAVAGRVRSDFKGKSQSLERTPSRQKVLRREYDGQTAIARGWNSSYLVDPASSHMLVSKIKPCMSKYKQVCTVKLRMAH